MAQTGKWSDGDTNATREITVTDDIELEAIFEVIAYTITIESANQEHGTVTIEVVGNQGMRLLLVYQMMVMST